MSETWERAKKIFHEASELGPAERKAYVDEACGEDAKLRAEVEALLSAQDAAGDFLGGGNDMTTAPATPLSEGPGTIVGRYKILQQIGEGGFGTVYMAEQEEPVRRKVALKIIKLGMDTRQVIARFEAERQALALMDHPNIARVLDAGSTKTGRPFFVMELVRGVPITRYCDQNNLSTAERIHLFLGVCSAVQHAHQKGIIHRDIKPSNVMITLHDGTPVPKVIDFGIAKATNQRLTEKTLFTQYHQFIGTPEYMSPEQAEMSGLDVDTRTDIYSLGVLLYELLTGTTPFDAERLRGMVFSEIHRFIREEDPHRPSTRVSTLGDAVATDTARHRSTDARTLRRALSGDLDWIVMKALEKDRTRRYETANGLMLDIQRHLNSEPVLASPPTPAYRMRKFVRRNRTSVSVAAAVGMALLGGLALATFGFLQADRERVLAEQEAEASQAISDFFTGMLASVNPQQFHLQSTFSGAGPAADPTATLDNRVSVEEMLRGAIDRIDGAFPGKLLLEAHARETIATTLLGLYARDAAVEQFEKVLDIRQQVLEANDPEVLRSRLLVAFAEAQRVKLVRAEELSRSALADLERELGAEHPLTMSAASLYGSCAGNQGKMALADSVMEITLERQRRVLGRDHRDTISTLIAWAGLYCWRGSPRAEELAGEAYEHTRRAYSPTDAISLSAAETYALSLTFLYRDAEAERIARETIARGEEVFGEHFDRQDMGEFALVRALNPIDKGDEMEAIYRSWWHKTSESGGHSWVQKRDWGYFLLQRGKVDEGVDALATQHAYWSPFERSDDVRIERLETIQTQAFEHYATALRFADRTDEWRALVQPSLDTLRTTAEAADAGSAEWNSYAWTLLTIEPEDLRRPEEALEWAMRAVEAAPAMDDPIDSANLHDTQAKAFEMTGKIALALESEQKAMTWLSRADDAARRATDLDLLFTVELVRYATTLGQETSAREAIDDTMNEFVRILEADAVPAKLQRLADQLDSLGFHELAEAPYRRALSAARSADKPDRELDALIALASLRARLGADDEVTGLLDDAHRLYDEQYVTEPIEWTPGLGYTEEGERSRAAVSDKVALALAHIAAGNLDEADVLIEQASCVHWSRARLARARLLWSRGNSSDAEVWYRRVHLDNCWYQRYELWPGTFAFNEAEYGRCLALDGKFALAERRLLGGYARMLEWGGPRSRNVVTIAGWIEELYDDWGKVELAAEWRENGASAGHR